MAETCLYQGEVVHRRLNPLRHELRYRVYNLLIDVDRIEAVSRGLKLFSYNRFNLFSVRDRSHGPGDGTPVCEHAWKLVRAAAGGGDVRRIYMFCYPSILGYVFNPLTVYYGLDGEGRLRVMVYEVNNTFGGRHSYVLPVGEDLAQTAPKHFFVSPFNGVEGHYTFNFTAPEDHIALGVALSVDGKAILKAYVSGTRLPLSDGNLLHSFIGIPLLTLKVIGAIHFHALKLWWKGLKLNRRPKVPNHTVDFLPEARSQP